MFRQGKLAKIAKQVGIGESAQFAKLFLANEKANVNVATLYEKYGGHGILTESQNRKLDAAKKSSETAEVKLGEFTVKFNQSQVDAFNAALKQSEQTSSTWKKITLWSGVAVAVAGAFYAFTKIRSVFEAYRADIEAKTHLELPSVPEYLSTNWPEVTGALIAGVLVLGAAYYFKKQEANAFNLQDRLQLPKTQ